MRLSYNLSLSQGLLPLSRHTGEGAETSVFVNLLSVLYIVCIAEAAIVDQLVDSNYTFNNLRPRPTAYSPALFYSQMPAVKAYVCLLYTSRCV